MIIRQSNWRAALATLVVATLVASLPQASAADSRKNSARIKSAFARAAEPLAASIVRVISEGEEVGLGTVVDDEGHVLCKASVLKGAVQCRVAEDQLLAATRVGVSAEDDVALLRIDAERLQPVQWRNDVPPPGTVVAAVGADGEPLAVGLISSQPRRVGGPARVERPRGWLGVALGEGDAGLGVSRVIPRSAASQAGLQVGDRIQRIDGTEMNSMRQAIRTIGSHQPGQTIALVVQRDGEEVQLSATLGKPPTSSSPYDQWGGGPFSRRRTGFARVIPHDAVIGPDECGSPIIDLDGRVVGINIARALRVSTYALDGETVNSLVARLRAGETQATRAEPARSESGDPPME